MNILILCNEIKINIITTIIIKLFYFNNIVLMPNNDPYETGLVERDNSSNWFGGVGHSYAYCITPPQEYAMKTYKAKNIDSWAGTIAGYTGSFFTGIPGTVHTDCNGIIGNKYGLNTGAKCIDKQGILQTKYSYIDNTTSGFSAGQVPGTLYSAGKIPFSSAKIGISFFDDLHPPCSKVKLKYHLVDSAKKEKAKNDWTKPVHVADHEIDLIDDSNIEEAFSNNNNDKDNLVINLLLLSIFTIIVFKLLNK